MRVCVLGHSLVPVSIPLNFSTVQLEILRYPGATISSLTEKLTDLDFWTRCYDGIIICLFRQNTYLQNKKHMLTCQVGLVVIDLITSPVVSWKGCETPPQYRGSAVILCSTTVVRGPLSSWWPAVVVC